MTPFDLIAWSFAALLATLFLASAIAVLVAPFMGGLSALRNYRRSKREPERKPWTVDRDGRVRTDARPVELKARKES